MDKDILLKDRRALGVIVARMQVPLLTGSHRIMMQTCANRHYRSVLFLGTAEVVDHKNPFPYLFRKTMIDQAGIGLSAILPLPDNSDNARWVDTLDRLIQSQLTGGETAVLYGGRDSFIPHYKKDNGKYECIELSPTDYDSGTEARAIAAIELPPYSDAVAKAILWTLNQVK